MGGWLDRADEGLRAAVEAAGGRRALARALGLKHRMDWCTVPQDRVFQVAEATRLDPVRIRPDLEAFIRDERRRRRLAQVRDQFSLVRAAAGAEPRDAHWSLEEGMLDMLTTFAAVRFAAIERAIPSADVFTGRTPEARAARAWAMALALVVGRARATNIGGVFGVSRQNVDNASERYLRARDGDDPDDFLAGGDAPRVIERGRVRRAKAATDDLWAAEARFRAQLERATAPAETRRSA